MRKLALPLSAVTIVAVSLFGCDDSMSTEPAVEITGGEELASFGLTATTTSTTGIPMVILSEGAGYAYARGGAVNAVGDVAGTCEFAACLYSRNGVEFLPPVPGYSDDGEAYGINDRGQAVGYVEGPEQPIAVMWQRGEATVLGTLGGTFSIAADVNNSGHIVGYSTNTIEDDVVRAFLWNGGVMIDLGSWPGDETAYAWAINDRGQAVGYSYTSNVSYHALMWAAGEMIDLGSPPTGDYWLPRGINETGQVVGSSYDRATNSYRALLWSGDQLTDLGTLGGRTSNASDIDNRGIVVGSSYMTDDSRSVRATMWFDDQATNLGTLPGGGRSYATEINEAGLIAGSATDSDGTLQAVLWLPTLTGSGRTTSQP